MRSRRTSSTSSIRCTWRSSNSGSRRARIPELQSILKPAQEAFEREWYKTAVDLFPEWEGSGANFDIALDLVHYVMDGLAVSLLTHDIGEHERRMVGYLEDRLRELASKPATARA